jgi:TolA-binding protein
MINKLLLTLIILASSIIAKEISAFSAGDISSSNPYGLTSAEKHILNNKKKLDKFDTNVKVVKNSMDMLSERIDGIESILDGDSKKLHDTTNKLKTIIVNYDNDIKVLSASNDNLKKLIEKLLEDQVILIQNEENIKNNLKTLKKSQDNLIKLVNKINSVYISSNELKSNMSQFVTKKEFNKLLKLLDTKNVGSKSTKNRSKKEMMKEAKRLYKKEYFSKSIPIYEELVRLNYKPAESNYMLGKMWFVRKSYKKAISYFKTSAMLYDKGWWMPELLLDSAISFEKIGDIDNASSFYSSLIELYPETKQAKIANKNILK